jgi:hypothetical protein
MVRQILVQPLVPSVIDEANRAQLGIGAIDTFHERDHSQIDAGKVRISAKVIANHDRTLNFQLRKRAVSFIRIDLGTLERSVYFGHEPGFFVTAAQQVDHRLASIPIYRSVFCFRAIHLELINGLIVQNSMEAVYACQIWKRGDRT